MLILSTSAEEALGTGPCFYLSPSSSQVTKAEEELFRALTDMFTSCTCWQGRTGRQTCPEASSGQWHDVKSLPASPVDCLILCQSIFTYSSYRKVMVWQNPAYRDVRLSQAQGPELGKSQTFPRNPVTWNVMENGAGYTDIADISLVQSYVDDSFRRECKEDQQVFYEKSITYLCWSSKSNFINAVMGRNSSSSCGAIAWHNVHHTWRETHLKQRLNTAL